jgi:superfamily II DNA or RNA helicase
MKNCELLVLTSPPASGKTFWISALADVLEEKILVISPLRALADECRLKWGDRIDVMTPEEWMGKRKSSKTVIFDEFHLLFYWGDSFRPLLWEVFFALSEEADLVIALTATLPPKMEANVKTMEVHFERILWIDCGNQRLKTAPRVYVKAPSRKWVLMVMENQRRSSGVNLVFCRYRNEVSDVKDKLEESGFKCLTCVGGESKFMAKKLEISPAPDFIIATTVLSHGVNLPSIARIFFTYPVGNQDFWIQMVARGGRRGESYEVIALERPYGAWCPWKNLFQVLKMSLKSYLCPLNSFFN